MCEPELRRAAFRDLPLPPPRLLAAAARGEPRDRLLAAVVLGAQGRYAAAAALLDDVSRQEEPVLAALALATLGSHRRQLGGHTAARGPDAAALALASRGAQAASDPDGLDAPGAMADALLGLAADNLAVGRLTAARRLLASASGHLVCWRTRARADWVAAEIELAADRPEAALAPAERALSLAVASDARRHVIKSELVLAAALAATGEPARRDRAAALVAGALAAAEKYELCSLSWPAGQLAADLKPDQAELYRFRVSEVLHGVLLGSDPIGRRIAGESPWVPT